MAYAVPGGLIGVGTTVDPTLTRADRLVGHVLGYPGTLPDVYDDLTVHYYLLHRLLGVKSGAGEEGKTKKVDKLRKGEFLMINVGTTSVGGRVEQEKPEKMRIKLSTPVCCSPGDKVALSRRIEKHWRLIGWGDIIRGKTVELINN